jgi:YfiH family protein
MYQIPGLKKFKRLFCGYSEKKEGNMSFSWGEKKTVLENRKKFLAKAGVNPNSCVNFWVQDKNIVLEVDQRYRGRGIASPVDIVKADALICREKGVFLFLTLGDCPSLVFFDKEKQLLALAHAGWKSTNLKIASKVSQRLVRQFGCRLSDICVGIGPAIHQESYIFDSPIQKQKKAILKQWKPFLKELDNNRTAVDLIGYNKKQLITAGIPPENIFISEIDTAKNSGFFSHYRDSRQSPENEGRFVCLAGILSD